MKITKFLSVLAVLLALAPGASARPVARVYLVSGFTKTARCVGLMGQVVDNNGTPLEGQCFVLPYVDANDAAGAARFNHALRDFNQAVQTEFPWVYRIVVKPGILEIQRLEIVNPIVNS